MNRLARNALRQDGTPQLHHARGNENTRSRLNAADASAQDSDRSVAYVTGSTVRCGIHSARQAADNRCTPLCQCLAQFKCHTLGLIGAFAGSNNRGVAAGIRHAEWYPLAKNHQRRVGEALATPAGNRGRPKPLPNALEPVPYATRAAGWKANHPHWAAAGAPVPLPVRVTPRGELPVRLASGPTREFQPISTTPPTGPHGKFCQESHRR